MRKLKSLVILSILLIPLSSLLALDIIDIPLSPKNIFNLNKGKKEIIITIDDGPTPGVTDIILDELKNQNIQAAFFVIGQKAEKNPELMARISDEGHIIGNHTLTHPILTKLDPSNWKQILNGEFFGTHQKIETYFNQQREWYFRAPGGAWESKLAQYLNQDPIGLRYLGPLYWDIGGEILYSNGRYLSAADWDCWRKNLSVHQCLEGYSNETVKFKGGVILFHDVRKESAELITEYIKSFKKLGYSFKTLDDIQL